MNTCTCTHPTIRNGYCTACLCRVPTLNDALLVGVWGASFRRLQASRQQRMTAKRLLCVGHVRQGKVQIKQ